MGILTMDAIVKKVSFFFASPAKFCEHIMTRKKFAVGFTGYFIGSLSLFIWQYLSKGGVTALGFIFMLAAAFGFNVVMGIIASAVINLFMDLTGSEGNASGAFIILGTADFAKTLLIPSAILLSAFGAGSILGGLVFFFAAIFQLVLTIYLLRYGYKCSLIKAWIAYAMPFLLATLLIFMFVASAIIGLLSSL